MKAISQKTAATVILLTMMIHHASAFCGFYVSKADGTLKNKTSQVIIVHDGEQNVLTMYNDFTGDVKDFAMVVPVPVVLKKTDIRVIDQKLFTTLNDYSKPRLVEYYDQNPCEPVYLQERLSSVPGTVKLRGTGSILRKDPGVKIEAKYIVGEYDILILSAKESGGLKQWLTENGYHIPSHAEEVLDPYIKSNLKFFVVKVNPEEKKKLGGNFLRPIQISYSSPRFMLPIRLGMANADGDQDLVIYAFTKKGRIECTNYRSVSLPTGKNVPLFVQNNFQNFYTNLFQHQWEIEGKSVAMLEYAWDVSPANYLKCDPCVAAAPATTDLVQAGVWWLPTGDYPAEINGEPQRSENVFFTRIHVRYNRHDFPQDLMLENTPNTENYQARYIITHPATGEFNCEDGKKYLAQLQERRRAELLMLTHLTGKSYTDWDVVSTKEDSTLPEFVSYKSIYASSAEQVRGQAGYYVVAIGLLCLVSLLRVRRRRVVKA